MFDFRKIYLMQTEDICKIGISNNAKRRRREVDKSLPKNAVTLRFSVPAFFAERNEKRLHRKYGCGSHRWQKIGKDGGGTEWAKLNGLQRFCVRVDLVLIVLEQIFFTAAVLVIAAIMLVGI